jgi:exosortase/archaeosortase family protein
MRIPPGVRSRISSLKLPTASLCAIAGLVIAWPIGLFPGNLVPIPAAIAAIGDGVVAKIVSVGSVYLLETVGLFLPLKDGLLHIGDSIVVDVAVASGGFRVLLAVLAVSTAAAALASKPVWERLFIIGSGVPIAILCGVFRVMAACLLLVGSSEWLAELILFEVAGWLTIALAWGLLLTERKLLSRMLIPPPAREVVPVFRSADVAAHHPKRTEAGGLPLGMSVEEIGQPQSDPECSPVTSSEQLTRHTEPMLGAVT